MSDKKYDIYITFPGSLAEANADLYKLIKINIEKLKFSISRITTKPIVIIQKDADFSDDNYMEYLNNCSLVVFFTHTSFEENVAYNTELENVCKTLGITDFEPLKGNTKIFHISLDPPGKSLSPECLNLLVSYKMYEKNPYSRRIIPLNFDENGQSVSLYGKLLDLSYDLVSELKLNTTPFSLGGDLVKYIYLGLTTYDQQPSRDEIRRELQHYGYRILPLLNMPVTGDQFKDILIENLKLSGTVIQLMGSQYGELLKGTKHSVVDFQNQIISEFQKTTEGRELKRFIWIPKNLKINDQRQALYLKRLRRDEAGKNTEIIESPIEAFKTVLAERLEDTNHVSIQEYENISKTYIITEDESTPEFEQLYSTLSLSGLKVLILDHTEQIGIYARHLQALRDCDSIIIFQQGNNQFWLNSKLRDLIKSPGIGRSKPFKKIVVCSKGSPDTNLLGMINSRIELLKDVLNNPDIILQKLISE